MTMMIIRARFWKYYFTVLLLGASGIGILIAGIVGFIYVYDAYGSAVATLCYYGALVLIILGVVLPTIAAAACTTEQDAREREEQR